MAQDPQRDGIAARHGACIGGDGGGGLAPAQPVGKGVLILDHRIERHPPNRRQCRHHPGGQTVGSHRQPHLERAGRGGRQVAGKRLLQKRRCRGSRVAAPDQQGAKRFLKRPDALRLGRGRDPETGRRKIKAAAPMDGGNGGKPGKGETSLGTEGSTGSSPVTGFSSGPLLQEDALTAEHDPTLLLRQMRPVLHPDQHGFAVAGPGAVDTPLAVIAEAEGTTVVATLAALDAARLPGAGPMARISLSVHSALTAVGLTAAVATALAARRISANVIAGFQHDHIFVPWDRRMAAMAALQALSDG